ncbi:DUF134 domain-containing protein [Methanobacterium alcaliphilum]|uniref:DUF134 domain-containing protein n=1 Tax=Methanobacterium alcaliphilum TaxID=392018 RepID=UPI00200AE9F6|nr:DUF134 domain-containing protein [Methanobacterium alcaliphilum]MCK9151525.1 DUF134 domain-containing protein [Methanobacterium alcaliphilum]
MARPRNFRRIFREPEIKCFKPHSDSNNDFELIKITLDEFEALRLNDYQNIKQKKAAEIMGISQPTFHRIIISARFKVSKALVEGKIITIKGGDYITDKKRYKCNDCGFEWFSPNKEYEKCPDCDSLNIILVSEEEGTENITVPGSGRRRGYGGRVRGAGAPRVCKCTQCGYEVPKTPGIPCRNEKCPQCGGILCGAD